MPAKDVDFVSETEIGRVLAKRHELIVLCRKSILTTTTTAYSLGCSSPRKEVTVGGEFHLQKAIRSGNDQRLPWSVRRSQTCEAWGPLIFLGCKSPNNVADEYA